MYAAKRVAGITPLFGTLHFSSCDLKLLLMKHKSLLQQSVSLKAQVVLMLIFIFTLAFF